MKKLKKTGYESKSLLAEGRTGPWTHRKGPEYLSIVFPLPTNRMYAHETSNRTYRLRVIASVYQISSSTIKWNLQNLQLHLLALKFNGSDPITVIIYLTELSNTADDLQISEGEAHIALGFELTGEAASLYNTSVKYSAGTGRTVSSCPTAFAWLIRKYATNDAIKNGLDIVRTLTQKKDEDEEQFHTRFVNMHARGGSPWYANERITHYIDGLHSELRPPLHHFRSENANNLDLNLQDICNRALAVGGTFRARINSVQNRMGSKSSSAT